MKLKRGIKLLEQREGVGEPAKKGDRILYNLKMFLPLAKIEWLT